MKHHDKALLLRIGNKIGKTIRIDKTTELRARGCFVRLYMEMDLSKPLLSRFRLRRRVRRVEYEGFH